MKVKPPDGYHWMDYQGGPVLMPGDYAPHDGAVEEFDFEIIEERDPDRVRKSSHPGETVPAKPSERRRGSTRNPRGSAGGQRGGIKLSEANVKTLEGKRDEHNEKVKEQKNDQ